MEAYLIVGAFIVVGVGVALLSHYLDRKRRRERFAHNQTLIWHGETLVITFGETEAARLVKIILRAGKFITSRARRLIRTAFTRRNRAAGLVRSSSVPKTAAGPGIRRERSPRI